MSSLITAGILFYFGSSTIRGFALVLIVGVLVSMFTAITVSRSILRWVVRRSWARRPASTACARRSSRSRRRGAGAAGGRRARVFDIIGKRRWFFLFSGLITIPGLIFIILTPFSGGKAGLAVLDRLHRRHHLGGPLP